MNWKGSEHEEFLAFAWTQLVFQIIFDDSVRRTAVTAQARAEQA
jgi:hypothetical protein